MNFDEYCAKEFELRENLTQAELACMYSFDAMEMCKKTADRLLGEYQAEYDKCLLARDDAWHELYDFNQRYPEFYAMTHADEDPSSELNDPLDW